MLMNKYPCLSIFLQDKINEIDVQANSLSKTHVESAEKIFESRTEISVRFLRASSSAFLMRSRMEFSASLTVPLTSLNLMNLSI